MDARTSTGCAAHAPRTYTRTRPARWRFEPGVAHALAQDRVVLLALIQTIQRNGVATDVLAQAVGVDHDDEGERDGHAERRMAHAFTQGDQRGHAGHDGAMVAGKAAIADQVEGPAPIAHTGYEELDRADYHPGQYRCDEINDFHDVLE